MTRPMGETGPRDRAGEQAFAIRQLQRRPAQYELEYATTSFAFAPNIAAGGNLQLPMTNDEFPTGQYKSSSSTTVAENLTTGYSIIDGFIQCNQLGKDGFWHLFAGYTVTVGAPATAEEMWQVRLTIDMELWTATALVGGFNALWMHEAVDNRTNLGVDTLVLRTQALFYNGGVPATQRARFKATVYNDTAGTIQGQGTSFTLLRYGTAYGQVVGEPT